MNLETSESNLYEIIYKKKVWWKSEILYMVQSLGGENAEINQLSFLTAYREQRK